MKQEIRRRIVANPHDQERWLIISKGLYNLHLTLIGQLDLIILLNLWKGESPLGGRDISHNRTQSVTDLQTPVKGKPRDS